MTQAGSKSSTGRFFEDFRLDETIEHASPRTITEGDVALYHALTGNRFTMQTSNQFARDVGYHAAPVDDLFVFNAVFGLSVSDISRNARANLGYAGCDFLAQLYVGETVSARSRVIGLRETSGGETGIVYTETEGLDHRGVPILRFTRWVMVPKRDSGSRLVETRVPELPDAVRPITIPRHRLNRNWNDLRTGSPHRWEDYAPGEKIDHIDGTTVEDAGIVDALESKGHSSLKWLKLRLMPRYQQSGLPHHQSVLLLLFCLSFPFNFSSSCVMKVGKFIKVCKSFS